MAAISDVGQQVRANVGRYGCKTLVGLYDGGGGKLSGIVADSGLRLPDLNLHTLIDDNPWMACASIGKRSPATARRPRRWQTHNRATPTGISWRSAGRRP